VKRLSLITGLILAAGGVAVALNAPQADAFTVPAAAGATAAIPGFVIQSWAGVAADAAVSKPGYDTSGWTAVGARSTVYAGLLAAGKYPDPFYSTNLEAANPADFAVPWWYRADLSLGTAAAERGLRTILDVSGVISQADVWVNGTRVATRDQVTGQYTDTELDITAQVKPGRNSVAFKVYPNDPDRQLTSGWIDWTQTPPDHNMGIVRDVLVRRSGAVALRNAHVVTALAVPGLGHADLTVKADVRNDTNSTVQTTVAGTVAGKAVRRSVSLAAHQTRTVTFGTVGLDRPNVWWPAGLGGQPLYGLDLTATTGGAVSDRAGEQFGVRDVQATLNADGARAYTINGRPLLIRGAGWSPDLFLRWNPQTAADKLRYVRDLGLNTIRLEGHLEPGEFFDLTDKLGILTLPGWECCDHWEGDVNGDESGEPWTSADFGTARRSMAAEAARLRDHPSVVSFLIGSDFAPSARIEQIYLDALHAADWSTPVIAAASDDAAPITGPSGMKMTGPYDWVPPNYWYTKQEGGAFGFNSETSAGPDIPTLDTLHRMMTPAELDTLWKNFDAEQYHRSPSDTFGTLKIFDDALAGRYGAPTSLDDYVRKAQLAQYEAVRAQYEAYGRNFTDATNPSTGAVYWMLTSGWTSLHWQLFDAYLDQGGAYYGAKKADEPLHVQYSYDTRSVVVVNSQPAAVTGLSVEANLYNLDGSLKSTSTRSNLTAAGDGGKVTAVTLPAVSGLSTTYLARLVLKDAAGREVSRNVYWLSTKNDVIDWANNDWYYVPTTSYADLTGLNRLAPVDVAATTSSVSSDGTTTTTVTLTNRGAGPTPALLVDTHVLGAGGAPALPVRWSDNEVSLWPGESKTVTATYRTAELHGAAPAVRVTGWNVPTKTVNE
jgi:exo-1,4-beta-D-glucosaminidase